MRPNIFSEVVYRAVTRGDWALVGIGSTAEANGIHIAVLEGRDDEEERIYHTMFTDKSAKLGVNHHIVRYYRENYKQNGAPATAIILQDAVRIRLLPPDSLSNLRDHHDSNQHRFLTEYRALDDDNSSYVPWTEQEMRRKADHVSGFLGITVATDSLCIGGFGFTETIDLWPAMAALN